MDHIVLLVHKIFTITIPKPDNEEEKWPGNTVKIGQEIKCYITQIDKTNKLLFICATLNSDYLQGCRLPETFNIFNTGIDIKNNINGSKEINGSNITVLEDNDEETHVVIKIENHDPEEHIQEDAKSDNHLQIHNDDTDSYNNTNPIEYTESRKRKKRKCSETDITLEPEKKKKKKHVKKSKESDLETGNEEKMINNTTNIIHYNKCHKEEQQDNKKHKKNKKEPVTFECTTKTSDSEPEDYVEIKEEKPDVVTLHKTINENMEPQDLDDHMITEICIKTENSNKEKKKKSKKYDKTLRNIGSESETKIKSENETTNIFKMEKHNNEGTEDEEQIKYIKHNILESDNSSSLSSRDRISKKRKTDIYVENFDKEKKKAKKREKTSRNTDSEFEVKIESEDKTTNDTSKHNDEDTENEEQMKHMKNILQSDVFSNTSDHEHVSKKRKTNIDVKTELDIFVDTSDYEHVSKKRKKSKKSPKVSPDSKLKQHVKIKEEESD